MHQFLGKKIFNWACVTVFLGASAFAADAPVPGLPATPGTPGAELPPVTLDDTSATEASQLILSKLHLLNQFEVDAGQVGASKACAAEVKAFSEKMVKDHGEADGKLVQLAGNLKLTLVQEIPANAWEQQQLQVIKGKFEKALKAEACDFDVLYMKAMKAGHIFAAHVVALSLQQNHIPEAQEFLSKTLLDLKAHLDLSAEILKKIDTNSVPAAPSAPQEPVQPAPPVPAPTTPVTP